MGTARTGRGHVSLIESHGHGASGTEALGWDPLTKPRIQHESRSEHHSSRQCAEAQQQGSPRGWKRQQ